MKLLTPVRLVVGIIVTILVLYCFYWVAKTVSYKIFYQDMVRATITEMVRPESLKHNNEK
jgi:hypothetical protein